MTKSSLSRINRRLNDREPTGLTQGDARLIADAAHAEGKREGVLYMEVIRTLDRVKHFIEIQELFTSSQDKATAQAKAQQISDMWQVMATNFTTAARRYHTWLISDRSKQTGLLYDPDPTFINEFVYAQAVITNALNRVIQNPDDNEVISALRITLTTSPLDENFSDFIRNMKGRKKKGFDTATLKCHALVREQLEKHPEISIETAAQRVIHAHQMNYTVDTVATYYKRVRDSLGTVK